MAISISSVSSYSPYPHQTVHVTGHGFGSSVLVKISSVTQQVLSSSENEFSFVYNGRSRGRISVENTDTGEFTFSPNMMRPMTDRSNPSQMGSRGFRPKNVNPHSPSLSERIAEGNSVISNAAQAAGSAFAVGSIFHSGREVGEAAQAVVSGAQDAIRSAGAVGAEIGATVITGISSAFGESGRSITVMVHRWLHEIVGGAVAMSGRGGRIFSTLVSGGAGLALAQTGYVANIASNIGGSYSRKWDNDARGMQELLLSGRFSDQRSAYYSNSFQGRRELERWKRRRFSAARTRGEREELERFSDGEWRSDRTTHDERVASRATKFKNIGSSVLGGVAMAGGLVTGVIGVFGGALNIVTNLVQSVVGGITDGLKMVGSLGVATFAALAGVLKDSFKTSFDLAKSANILAAQTGVAFNRAFDAVSRLKDLGLNAGTLVGNSPASAIINQLRDSVVGNRSVAGDAMGGVADIRAMQARSNGNPYQTMISRSLVGSARWDEVASNPMSGAAMGRVKSLQDAFGLNPQSQKQIASDWAEMSATMGAFSSRIKGIFSEAVVPLLQTALPLLQNYFISNKGAIIKGIQDIGKWVVGELPPMLMKFGAVTLRVFSSITDAGAKAMHNLAENAPQIGRWVDQAVDFTQRGFYKLVDLAQGFFRFAEGLVASPFAQGVMKGAGLASGNGATGMAGAAGEFAGAHPWEAAGAGIVAYRGGGAALRWGGRAAWGALRGAGGAAASSAASAAATSAASGGAASAAAGAGATWLGPGMGFLGTAGAAGGAGAAGAGTATAGGGLGAALGALAVPFATVAAVLGAVALAGNAVYTSFTVYSAYLDKKKGAEAEEKGWRTQYEADKKAGRTDLPYKDYADRMGKARDKDADAEWYNARKDKVWWEVWKGDSAQNQQNEAAASGEATALRNSVKSKAWSAFQAAKRRGDLAGAAQIANRAGHPEWITNSTVVSASAAAAGSAAPATPGGVGADGMTSSLFGKGITYDAQGRPIWNLSAQGFLTRNQGTIQTGADGLSNASKFASEKADSFDRAANGWSSEITSRLDRLIGISDRAADGIEHGNAQRERVVSIRNQRAATDVHDRFLAQCRA